jgi:SAM-dependent methyltransferase
MSKAHDAHVTGQFGPRARAYVESAVHAAGEDLARIGAVAEANRPGRALDLGCGGGHVAYTMAAYAGAVTACDLSEAMLRAVTETATARGLGNVVTVQSSAEKLPFPDESFDMIGCRFSAHHWRDVDAGLREARRVMKPGAPALFVDAVAPPSPLLDTHLQAIELLRDTSHVRDYTVAEWSAKLSVAGFRTGAVRTWRLKMEFAVWIARMATPGPLADAIRLVQQSAPADVQRHFEIEPDGSFMLDVALFEAVAA